MEPQQENSLSTFRTILAAIDSEPQASRVLELAARLATDGDATMHIVHVVVPLVPPAGITEKFATALGADQMQLARDYTDKMVLFAAARFAGKITVHLVRSRLTEGILHVAERIEADVLVVGTHDYRGVKHALLGSVAAEVTSHARCPVLVARPLSYAPQGPAVEPVCPDCATARAESAGATIWCARHSAHHPRAHVLYEYPQGFGAGSQLLPML